MIQLVEIFATILATTAVLLAVFVWLVGMVCVVDTVLRHEFYPALGRIWRPIGALLRRRWRARVREFPPL